MSSGIGSNPAAGGAHCHAIGVIYDSRLHLSLVSLAACLSLPYFNMIDYNCPGALNFINPLTTTIIFSMSFFYFLPMFSYNFAFKAVSSKDVEVFTAEIMREHYTAEEIKTGHETTA